MRNTTGSIEHAVELHDADLAAVTGGVSMSMYDPLTVVVATSQPESKPTTYGEAFNALITAAGGTPR